MEWLFRKDFATLLNQNIKIIGFNQSQKEIYHLLKSTGEFGLTTKKSNN